LTATVDKMAKKAICSKNMQQVSSVDGS